MSDVMKGAGYGTLLIELKTRIHTAQYADLCAEFGENRLDQKHTDPRPLPKPTTARVLPARHCPLWLDAPRTGQA